MFKIVAVVQGDYRVAELNEAFELLPKNLNVEFVPYEIFGVDGDVNIFEQCQLDIADANFLYLDFHGGLTYFKNYEKLSKSFLGKKQFFFHSGIENEVEEMVKECKLSKLLQREILSYKVAGGVENTKNLLLYIANKIGGLPCEYGEMILPNWSGIYNFDGDWQKHIAEIAQSDKVVIGVLMHYYYANSNDHRHIDALIAKIAEAGYEPLPIYSNMMPLGDYGGLIEDLQKYFTYNGKTIIHSLIVTAGFSLSITSAPGSGGSAVDNSVFGLLDVPVFQAMTTSLSLEQWQNSLKGLEPMSISMNVAQPEFDGQIISKVFAYTDEIQTEYGSISVAMPMEERIEKLIALVANWARLKKLPQSEKKVAIILHNSPPRADLIGAAYGLDSMASVYELWQLLKLSGIKTAYDFNSSKEILAKIISGLTNDNRFLSFEDMLARCEIVLEAEDYEPWQEFYSQVIKEQLETCWGSLPGEFMAVDSKILVPGFIDGNIFIALQPSRAIDQAEDIEHSPYQVCSYQYLAFYHYIEHIFKANAVIHLGTHGTLEWLPGKEIGLSKDCYPDIAIGALPNIYPYIIDVPGEGAQAKRRSSAVIIDHLIPAMKEAGLYGELSDIENLLEQYYKALAENPEKLSVLVEDIYTMAKNSKILEDMPMTYEEYMADYHNAIAKIHLWLSEIKSMKIRDGLHILGQVPTKDDGRLQAMLRLLVGVDNGEVLSVNQGIAKAMGLDLDQLLENLDSIADENIGCGKTNAMIIDEIDDIGRNLFAKLDNVDYDASKINEIIKQAEIKTLADVQELTKTLNYVCQVVYPKVGKTTDEMSNLLSALNGCFVPPGGSGAVSRGKAEILPTGCNFYSIDPSTIPSGAAYKVGQTLAKQLIAKHEAGTGEMLKNIAIVVYSGDVMKTGGDDIGEILYLYGVRPVYLGGSDRVVGLEAISLEELGRPRIDVTLRISGLLRDTFPNLIDLVDDAVNLVASLDEPVEMNFVRGNVLKDVEQLMSEGVSEKLAQEQAKLRIFGCPPGTYGGGVDLLVYGKKWNNSDDLADAYNVWSGNAYGKNYHGEKMQGMFQKRLAVCDATVKNISSFEEDMMSDDDFFIYHGGLIAATKKASGKKPASYTTQAGDTKHIKTKTIEEETGKIVRARLRNPQWIEGMQKHGYSGAAEFSQMFDIVFGWDATSDIVEDHMYDGLYETYMADEELRQWIANENPYALHAMAETLLEANQRQMWQASLDKVEKLQEIYLAMEGSFEDM